MTDPTDEARLESGDPGAVARAVRMARGAMTQGEFSKLVGRPQSVVSDWERGVRVPGLQRLAELEVACGLPMGSIAVAAGYFVPDALGALREQPIASRQLTSRRDVTAAIEAADALDLEVRVVSGRSGEGRIWSVELVAPSSTEAEGDGTE